MLAEGAIIATGAQASAPLPGKLVEPSASICSGTVLQDSGLVQTMNRTGTRCVFLGFTWDTGAVQFQPINLYELQLHQTAPKTCPLHSVH